MKINDARKYCIYAQVYTVLLQYRGPGVLFRSPPATATLRNKKSKQNQYQEQKQKQTNVNEFFLFFGRGSRTRKK